LTVDTPDDLELMRKVFGSLSQPDRLLSVKDVVPFLDWNSSLLQINQRVQQKKM
jgi:spore coat polysaccharide biosynthesis protein SpsF (cytidylyltransferase family)